MQEKPNSTQLLKIAQKQASVVNKPTSITAAGRTTIVNKPTSITAAGRTTRGARVVESRLGLPPARVTRSKAANKARSTRSSTEKQPTSRSTRSSARLAKVLIVSHAHMLILIVIVILLILYGFISFYLISYFVFIL